jgi:mono/diheme cytochrome c family protein
MRIAVCLVCVMTVGLSASADDGANVRFGRDVLPILSANCFACHGPDESQRKANLRLDDETDAKASHDSGIPIIPGDAQRSVLVERITSKDQDLVMPPADSHRQLTDEQIQILKTWIAEGAKWGRHWSFESIERPVISSLDEAAESHPIDVLIESELRLHELALQAPADPHVLVRRLSLDLIGLPPTVNVADAFAADPSPAAFEKLVDEMLASPQFGEHWARMWMDLGRYADTRGYEKDLGRTMWPWRDWLIETLNADMPLDQMTREMLAGDLLPNATEKQLIATAFHRNTMCNDEGGTDDEEFRTVAVKDRVDTTIQVWMGLTAGCAKCHTHKYDPISQQDYYSLYAIFNQSQDADRYDDAPTLPLPDEALKQKQHEAEAAIADLKDKLELAEVMSAQADEASWQFGTVEKLASTGEATLKVRDDHSIVVNGTRPAEDVYSLTMSLSAGRHTVLRLEALTEKFPDGQLGVGRNAKDPNFVLSEIEVELTQAGASRRLTLARPQADFAQDGWPVTAALDGDLKTGWAVSPRQREKHFAFFEFEPALELDADARLQITLRQHYGDSLTLRRFRLSTSGEDPSKVDIPQSSEEERQLQDQLAAATKTLQDLKGSIPKLPIMKAVEPDRQRVTRIHLRGNFLDPGDEVKQAIPTAFHPWSSDQPVDRLAVAEWLMSSDNTLTPRVWSNRIWARLFGMGIVETEEDFGALGSVPTHPDLLDWLAVEYRDNGWSLKKLLKTIVMSRTYQQSSRTSELLRLVDPANRLLSRGPRYRLSAEVVRDQALAASGLLSKKMGGPPVMPPQPDGLWRSTYNGQKWVNAEGEDRFRRALYTYLKRTTPYPSMTTFDGGRGEICQIRRIRTNTPLQALVTLNDPVFMEAAGKLAAEMLQTGSKSEERITTGLRRALIRPIRPDETGPLVRLQQDAQQSLAGDSEKAQSLIQATRCSVPANIAPNEAASWIVVANTILNLDEFLTRN